MNSSSFQRKGLKRVKKWREVTFMKEWMKPLYFGYLQALNLPQYLVSFPRMSHLKICWGPTQFFVAMALKSSVGKSECWNASREQGTHMFLESSHRGFRALHRGRAAHSLLHCNRIVGDTQNELDRYMRFNHILQYYQADMSYTIYMVCSRFCTITKQFFFFNAQTAWYPKLGEDRRMSGTTALLLTWKNSVVRSAMASKACFFHQIAKSTWSGCKIQSKCEQIKIHHSHLL